MTYLEAIGFLLYGEMPWMILFFGILLFAVTLGILSCQPNSKNLPRTF